MSFPTLRRRRYDSTRGFCLTFRGRRMRREAGYLALAILMWPPAAVAADMPTKAAAVSSDNRWEATFNSEVRYFTWTSSHGFPTTPSLAPQPQLPGPSKGSQVYVPYGLEIVGRPVDDWKLEFLVRSGYFSSSQSTPAVSASASGTTDTTFASTVTYYGWTGIQPFVKVSVNIPTGVTRLTGTSAVAKADADIVDTPVFGEGLNIGPTIGANIPITANFLVSLGVGATYRGAFDREGSTLGADGFPLGTSRVNPGDVTTFNLGASYQLGHWVFQAAAFYSMETQTSLDGAPFMKNGDRTFVSAAAGYTWNDNWSSRLSTTFNHSDRNKTQMAGFADLVVEALNSNSDITTVAFTTTYKKDAFSIGPTVNYMHRDHNAWSPQFLTFLPAKDSVALGVTGGYDVSKRISINGRIERRWTHEADNPDKFAANNLPPPLAGSGVSPTSTDSWLFLFGGLIKFGGT
jgi:hypothetical protein